MARKGSKRCRRAAPVNSKGTARGCGKPRAAIQERECAGPFMTDTRHRYSADPPLVQLETHETEIERMLSELERFEPPSWQSEIKSLIKDVDETNGELEKADSIGRPKRHIAEWRAKNPPAPKLANDDPLATDKIKVERYLKRFGLTLDDLPDGFWSESEVARGYLLGQTVGPVRSHTAREKRMTERGYPADYYDRPDDERRRLSANVRWRRWRARQPANSAAPVRKPSLPAANITTDWIGDKHARLKQFTSGNTPLARQLRRRKSEIVRAAATYHRLANALGRAPYLSELAAELGCSRAAAQNRVRVMTTLYDVGGPWH